VVANHIHGKPPFLLQEYCLESREISPIVWQLMVRYRVHNSPPLVPFSKTIHLTKFHPSSSFKDLRRGTHSRNLRSGL